MTSEVIILLIAFSPLIISAFALFYESNKYIKTPVYDITDVYN